MPGAIVFQCPASKIKPQFFIFCYTSISAQEAKEDIAEIKKLINLAVLEYNSSNYDKALDYSKQALVISFECNDNLYIAQSYNTIGVIFNECSDSNNAIQFYEKALFYAKKVNNDKLYNWIYGNLGSVYYFNQIDVKKGIDYYKKSLHYAVKNKDKEQIEYTKLNLASAYFSLYKY